MFSPDEKRKSIRIPVDLDIHFHQDNKDYAGRILNLSADGAFLNAHHLVDANEELDFTFHLPGTKQPIRTRGKVIWGGSIEGPAVRTFGMGIHFEQIAPDQKKAIEAYIDHLLKA